MCMCVCARAHTCVCVCVHVSALRASMNYLHNNYALFYFTTTPPPLSPKICSYARSSFVKASTVKIIIETGMKV